MTLYISFTFAGHKRLDFYGIQRINVKFCIFFRLCADEEKMAQYAQEEKHIREENLRLQRKLQLEMERRENLCRHLSESESSLEMDDER